MLAARWMSKAKASFCPPNMNIDHSRRLTKCVHNTGSSPEDDQLCLSWTLSNNKDGSWQTWTDSVLPNYRPRIRFPCSRHGRPADHHTRTQHQWPATCLWFVRLPVLLRFRCFQCVSGAPVWVTPRSWLIVRRGDITCARSLIKNHR